MEMVANKDLYRIYASSYFNDVLLELSKYLEEGIINVMKFFNLEHINKLKIYLYSDSREYQKLFKPPYQTNGIAGCFCKIQEQGINNRVIWFDEGIATFLSGERNG